MVVDIEEAQKDPQFRELLDESIEKGAVLSMLVFDTVGNTEDIVKNTLIDFIARLTKEEGVLYCKGEIHEVLKQEDGLFSGYSEVNILTASFNHLVNIAVKYGPVLAEILRPEEIKLTLAEAQNVILDASQASQEFVNYIMQNVIKGEKELEFRKIIQAKAKLAEDLKQKSKQ